MWNDPFYPYITPSGQDRHTITRQPLIPPSVELITLDEARTTLRVTPLPGDATDPGEDALIQSYIVSSREFIENIKSRIMVLQTWRQVMNGFTYPIRLAPCPVIKVLSLSFLDWTNTVKVVDPSDYRIDTVSEPALIIPHFGKIWPIPLREPGSVVIEFQAGILTPITANLMTNLLTVQGGRVLETNERLTFSNRNGLLPNPIIPSQFYYVVNPSGATFQLATTPDGSPITLASNGSGFNFIGQVPEGERTLMFLLLHHFYENRLAIAPGSAIQLPFTLDELMWNHRVTL